MDEILRQKREAVCFSFLQLLEELMEDEFMLPPPPPPPHTHTHTHTADPQELGHFENQTRGRGSKLFCFLRFST